MSVVGLANLFTRAVSRPSGWPGGLTTFTDSGGLWGSDYQGGMTLPGPWRASILLSDLIRHGQLLIDLLYACADHFGVENGALQIVPLDPPVTRQSLANGEVGAGMTDAASAHARVPVEVRDGSRHLQDAVMRPCRQTLPEHSFFK